MSVIRGTPQGGMKEMQWCSPNNRTNNSGNTAQWRQDNRCVWCNAGAWRGDNTYCTYSDRLGSVPRTSMPVIRGTPERGVKRMHFRTCLIFGDFQRGVPRTIGRTIRGTLSNGVKIIDMFSYAASKEVFPEQTDERFRKHYRMASR